MSACHPLNRTSPSDRRAMRSDPSRVLDAALTASLRLERHGSSAHYTTQSDSCVCRAQPSQPTSPRCSYPTDSPSQLTRAEGEDRPADPSLHFFSAAVPPPARPAGFSPSFTLRPGSATWCDYASAVRLARVRALRRFTRGPCERAEPSQVRALRRLRPRPAYARRRPAVLLETEVLRKGAVEPECTEGPYQPKPVLSLITFLPSARLRPHLPPSPALAAFARYPPRCRPHPTPLHQSKFKPDLPASRRLLMSCRRAASARSLAIEARRGRSAGPYHPVRPSSTQRRGAGTSLHGRLNSDGVERTSQGG
jgi:hypothetical protein